MRRSASVSVFNKLFFINKKLKLRNKVCFSSFNAIKINNSIHLYKNKERISRMPAFSRAGEDGISRKNKSSIVSLPIILKKKVNFAKIKKEGKEELAQWTETKVTTMLSFEDEVLNGLIVNMFDECSETGEAVDGTKFYEQLLPFLEKENTETFMSELWQLVTNLDEETGVPKQFIEAREAQKRKREEKADQFRKSREDLDRRRDARRGRDRDRRSQHGYNNERGGSSGGGGGKFRGRRRFDSREPKRELPYDR